MVLRHALADSFQLRHALYVGLVKRRVNPVEQLLGSAGLKEVRVDDRVL